MHHAATDNGETFLKDRTGTPPTHPDPSHQDLLRALRVAAVNLHSCP
jgi:hypothetical protein